MCLHSILHFQSHLLAYVCICVWFGVIGMLLTDLKARMAESPDEVRGISDLLLQRVSVNGRVVGLKGTAWTVVVTSYVCVCESRNMPVVHF